MGCDSYILSIGPFSKNILEYCDYPEGYYNQENEGAIVINQFCNAPTTSTSKELAELFGVDIYDCTTHEIKEENIDWDGIKSTYFTTEDFEALKILIKLDHKLYFIPEC